MANINGTNADESLIGDLNEENYINGKAGDDSIVGGVLNDELLGGSGFDTLEGGEGNNYLDGGADDDLLIAGDGDDTIEGGSGNGQDTIEAGNGNNYIDGGSGDDLITAGDGNDAIKGGSGNGSDTIDAGEGNNWIDAGSGDDMIMSGNGDDEVLGGSGDDTIKSGGGNDHVEAGSGHDCVLYDLVVKDGNTIDYFDGGSGTDTLKLCLTTDQLELYAEDIEGLKAAIEAGNKKPYTTSFGLTVRYFEKLEIIEKITNVAPTVADDLNSLTEDEASVGGNVLTNDSDDDGDPLVVGNPGVYNGTYGDLTLNADGTYTYTNDVAGNQNLDDGEMVMDTFSVDVFDGIATSTSELKIVVNGLNDAPVAVDDNRTINEDSAPINGNVLTNDTDVDNEPLTVTNPGVYVGAHGTLTLNANGTYTYAPDNASLQSLDDGESVLDSFNVDITDGDAGDSSTLNITINGLNDAPNSGSGDPTAGDDFNSLTEDDTNVGGNVLTNDTDPDIEPLTVANAGVYVGTHGTLTLNGDGTYNYVINPADHQDLDDGETRVDNFNVVVTDGDANDNTNLEITINGLNDAPVAVDDANSFNEDEAGVAGNVLTNDTDVDVEPLAVANPGVIVGLYGTLTLNGDGSYNYVADPVAVAALGLANGDTAVDSFNVDVTDGDLTDSSVLDITIVGVNTPPVAVDDGNTLTEDDTNVGGNVLTNDTDDDADPLNVNNPGVYNGLHGVLTLAANGTYDYAINPADHQDLDDGETRVDTFNVTISDGADTDDSVLAVTITGANDAPNSGNGDPTAGDDVNSLTEDDTNVGGNVLLNDTDPDIEPLTVANAGVYVGTHGTLTLNGDGSYDYVINPANFQGLDSGESLVDNFNVIVTDGDLNDDTNLEITINGLNDAPVGVNDTNSMTEDDSSAVGNVLTNDTDVDVETLNVVNPGVFAGTHGTLTLNADGSYSYDINPANFQSMTDGDLLQDTFNYEVTDGDATDMASLTIDINGINDAPVAVDDTGIATVKPGVNTALFGNVLTNDSDAEQADPLTLNVLSFTKTSATNFGTFNGNADGSWTFFISVLPPVGNTVIETWEYVVEDNGGLTDVGQLTFEITGGM